MAKEQKVVPQAMYSISGSKELLQKVLNDPKYCIQRWNPSKKVYDSIYPYQVFRTVLKKQIADAKFPNKGEIESVADMNIRVCDELVELIPELVTIHLDHNMKFKLPTQPNANGVIYRKYVGPGEKTSDVRNIQENRVDGKVKSVWGEHYIVKCSSKRPKDVVKKTRIA